MRRFTLHVRLTRRCQADCAYCSSWREDSGATMSFEHFKAAIDFIAGRVLPILGHPPDGRGHASIQYVGGDILVVPRKTLVRCVTYAREVFGGHFGAVRDGVQSNLAASRSKALFLDTLFGGRVGTSVDSLGDQRTLSGSAQLYRAAVDASVAAIRRRRGRPPSAIFVVDAPGLASVGFEMDKADTQGYGLVLRPVFRGGRDVRPAAVQDILAAFAEGFDRWALRSRVSVEPFTHLLASRLATLTGDPRVMAMTAACPFQNDCAQVSLDLEPDGTLYTCLDMADSGQFPFGNAVLGTFDQEAWERLRRRSDHLDSKCRRCPWVRECAGGCMSEAVHRTGDPWSRTELCEVWEALFARIDSLIARSGARTVSDWMQTLSH